MQVLLNNKQATFKHNSLSLSGETSMRTSGSITFLKTGDTDPKSGDRVDIFDGSGAKIFGGFVKKPKLTNNNGLVEIKTKLVDNTDIMNRRVVAETYTARADHDIIEDIHKRYLKDEGVKLGVISSDAHGSSRESKQVSTESEFRKGTLSSVEVSSEGVMTLENVSSKPPLTSTHENFEDRSLNFDLGLRGGWERTTLHPYSGSYCYKNDHISSSWDDEDERGNTDPNFKEESFTVTVGDGLKGKLSFRYWISSKDSHYFKLLIDSEEYLRVSGLDETWRLFETDLDPGDHDVKLLYEKMDGGSEGYDQAMIDELLFEEWEGLTYAPNGQRVEPKITSQNGSIKRVIIDYIGFTPPGTSVDFYYMLDGMSEWQPAGGNGVDRMFNGATGIDIKAELTTDDTTITPAVDEIRYKLETVAGTTIRRSVFNYVSAAQSLDDLAELSGATWWITPDKTLHYVDRSEFKAPWSITPDHMPTRDIEVETDLKEYRNRQYMRAGKDTTDIQTETMKGDGEKKTFNVGYGVAERPTVKVNGTSHSVGIRQVDENKHFYWAKNEKEITQDDTMSPLTSSDTLTIEYKGLYPIIVVAEDQQEVQDMQQRTGDTGLYENLVENQNIDDSDVALEFANSKLRKYARINKKVTFETIKKGLQPGQLLPISLPEYRLNDEFLIRSVEAKPFNDDFIVYAIEAVDGEDVGGWGNFFKWLARADQTYVIRENEVLIRVAHQEEGIGWTGTVGMTYNTCVFPSPTVYPAKDFYPC